ncbi:MAG: phosphoribosylformylglycinamidine cyclo-ligase [Thermoplasmata archaeon]|nr:MAG: phosphoribosylformylglycinamidine cyclo-ligase [Thermoplasmata archaeon]
MTYAEAGVDIDKEEGMVKAIISKIKTAGRGFAQPLDLPGHYTGLVDFGEVALSLCTDSIGTKGKIADALGKWDTVGIDCMAMNANDMICIGATPIAFVDFFAIEKYDEHMAEEIGIGLARAAEMAGVSIIGGETASLPDIISGFELAGTCLGYVKKEEIITGEDIAPGDVIIGLKSSGIHSNGLTLARKIVERNGLSYQDCFPGSNLPVGETLLIPTSIYVKEVLEVVRKFKVKGMAHITGGGLKNLSRLKKGVEFKITDPFEPQDVFVHLQKLGNVRDKEMYRTFNMGMGFCMVAEKEDAEGILGVLEGKVEAKVVGEVVEGEGVSLPRLGLKY